MAQVKIRRFEADVADPSQTITIPLLILQTVTQYLPGNILSTIVDEMDDQSSEKIFEALTRILEEVDKLKTEQALDGLLFEFEEPRERIVVSLE